MIKIIQFIGLVFALMIFSLNCQAAETGIVSGTLNLGVPGKTVAYVQFMLVELQPDESRVILGQQPFVKAKQPVTPFSVNYNVQQIDPKRRYKLAVIVATDSNGDSILDQYDFPVITYGQQFELNIAIDIPPEPIE